MGWKIRVFCGICDKSFPNKFETDHMQLDNLEKESSVFTGILSIYSKEQYAADTKENEKFIVFRSIRIKHDKG